MGEKNSRLDLEMEAKCQDERFSENNRILKIVPLVFIAVSSLYLLQYRFFPGIENESPYFGNYIFQFVFAITISFLFRIILPLLTKLPSIRIRAFIFGIYYYLMFVFCINLTILDMQISEDYSAYAVGLFMLAYMYRISWKKYIPVSISGILLFVAASVFGFDNLLTPEKMLPLFIFTSLSVYMVYNRESSRYELLGLKVKLEESALKDHLTGMYNRRYMFDFLTNRFALFNRYGTSSSILMLDLDHFKKINDQLGHNIGDSVLKSLSRIIQDTIRDTDRAFRFGGEEFLVVLSDTRISNAVILAQRLRKAIESYSFEGVPWQVTTSIGLAEIQSGDKDDDLIERADKNLYEAKRLGRNRVVK